MLENEPVRRFRRPPLIVGAVVGGVFAVSLGVAYAQTDPSTTTPTPSTTQVVPSPAQPPAPGNHPGRGHGRFGGKLFGAGPFGGPGMFGGMIHGKPGGIHGEFTVKKPDGSGYQTWATQLGEVTDVSGSSITVRSEDGFSRSYAIGENTTVNAGRDGIATIKSGDTVRIAGVVEDGKARAAAVVDSTSLGRIGEHWGFPRRK